MDEQTFRRLQELLPLFTAVASVLYMSSERVEIGLVGKTRFQAQSDLWYSFDHGNRLGRYTLCREHQVNC